jgi:hypothetical protein
LYCQKISQSISENPKQSTKGFFRSNKFNKLASKKSVVAFLSTNTKTHWERNKENNPIHNSHKKYT